MHRRGRMICTNQVCHIYIYIYIYAYMYICIGVYIWELLITWWFSVVVKKILFGARTRSRKPWFVSDPFQNQMMLNDAIMGSSPEFVFLLNAAPKTAKVTNWLTNDKQGVAAKCYRWPHESTPKLMGITTWYPFHPRKCIYVFLNVCRASGANSFSSVMATKDSVFTRQLIRSSHIHVYIYIYV